jgi:hypothetical protein
LTNNFSAYGWSDGTPVQTEPGTTTGLFQTGLDGGFEVSLPADTTPRRVRVHVGLYGGESIFGAYLSDFSAAAYIDTSVSNVYGNSYAIYTLDYQAASPGQSLVIHHRANRLFDLIYGNMTWQAVTLSHGDPAAPQPVLLLNPVLSGDHFSFTFSTETGRIYAVQFADRLESGTSWLTWTNVTGTGETAIVRQPWAGSVCRFYRVETE